MPLGLFRNFGVWEILILLFVVLLFFGPKRLPEMGRSLGRGMREFKDSITGNNPDDDEVCLFRDAAGRWRHRDYPEPLWAAYAA